ncbi:MAG TPA: CheR family methyltransferase, partial [Dehalococcoidia bacterium]|nr:CheR family methyltransferase [Dehalococcoidia bacterium]
MTSEPDEEFERLLVHLRETRGFDFTAYKRSSLMRRVQKRMSQVGVSTFTDYVDYLEVHPDEFVELFNTILINATSFFRDLPAWEFLAKEIVPRIIAARGNDDPIRVWSAGCASGEEAYTVAMIFAEALGFDQVKNRVKIYATDADEEALIIARQGNYTSRAL